MSPNAQETQLSRPLTVVAIVILAGFAVLLYHMYQVAPTREETLWNRSLVLFGSVEAIAFTAAGYLFGKEVHREQAQKAEQRAEEKTAEAGAARAAAAEAKAKGESLKKAIEAKQPSLSRGTMDESLQPRAGGGDPAGGAALNELATLAQSLFP
jgi:cytochrome bd-type quinol oxidase subunit 1